MRNKDICLLSLCYMVWFMLFNATFIISCMSVLLVEETGVPRENHRPVASHIQTLSHNVVLSTLHHEQDFWKD